MTKRCIISVTVPLLAIGALAFLFLLTEQVHGPSASVFKAYRLIGHAFGEIDGNIYTNSLEAFQKHYALGERIFEVDFAMTRDGAVVCLHEGSEHLYGLRSSIRETSLDEFRRRRILGRYTPLDLHDLIGLMDQHHDMYIVTDHKGDAALMHRILSLLVAAAEQRDPGISERIIPQVYDEETYEVAKLVHPFREVVFTLYRSGLGDGEIMDFLGDKPEVTAVTVHVSRFSQGLADAIAERGRFLFVHTVNSPRTMRKFREAGAYGFYTDTYSPKKSMKGRDLPAAY